MPHSLTPVTHCVAQDTTAQVIREVILDHILNRQEPGCAIVLETS